MQKLYKVFLAAILLFPTVLSAEVVKVGTQFLQFVPMQVGGVTEGCTMSFKNVTLDKAYMNGQQILIDGNIFLKFVKEKNRMILGLKIGLHDLSKLKVEKAPYFAYLSSSRGSTSKSMIGEYDGDEAGYKFFVFGIDDNSTKVVVDFIHDQGVTVGFNRRKGGLDVLSKVDFSSFDKESYLFGSCINNLLGAQ